VAAGDAGLVLQIKNEVTELGSLVGVAAVLDGALVLRERGWRPGEEHSLELSTTRGRHRLCIVAAYQGRPVVSNGGAYYVRAPRLIDLVPGTAVAVRVSLQEMLGNQPYVTAKYSGGSPYAATASASSPDVASYVSRLDETCAGRW
jgi:hypothetical protein